MSKTKEGLKDFEGKKWGISSFKSGVFTLQDDRILLSFLFLKVARSGSRASLIHIRASCKHFFVAFVV